MVSMKLRPKRERDMGSISATMHSPLAACGSTRDLSETGAEAKKGEVLDAWGA